MTRLHSLHSPATVAVIGASGGIGSEMVSLLAETDTVARIIAFSRSELGHRSAKVENHSIDLLDEVSIERAGSIADKAGPLDLVFVATGLLHDEQLSPEKSMQSLDASALLKTYAVNAVGPALVAKHFLPLVRKHHKTVFAALSARVGSIADNKLGGWAGYRSSKAALNMLLKICAIEQARKFPNCAVIALHPGTVDTALSRPFSRNVPEDKLFTAAQSAHYLLDVIDTVSPEDSGGFFAWDGSAIPY